MVNLAIMSLTAMLAALATLGVGVILKHLIIRSWDSAYVDPRRARFPQLCPVCLSPKTETIVDEESVERQTAYYVIAQKLEWWKAAVPHCSKCAQKIFKGKSLVLFWVVCAFLVRSS